MQGSRVVEPEGRWRQLVKSAQIAVTRHWLATSVGTLLVGVALLLVCVITRPLPHYILVIDSGSTGTRIHAYIWRDRFRQLPILQSVPVGAAWHKVPRRRAGDKRAYERVETEPGLDHYINDPKGLVEAALSPLLDWAEEVVPESRWESTPVFLFATAGLRKLPLEHQENILGTLRHILANSRFRFKPLWARIISGESEGIFGWIALNYLAGFLAPHPLFASRATSMETDADSALESIKEGKEIQAAEEGLKTVGSLDLGGSSLEVTFVPDKSSSKAITANISVLGVKYGLYTYTHRGYGLNDAFDKSVTILLEGPPLKDARDHVWEDYSAGLKATAAQQGDLAAGLKHVGNQQINAGKQAYSLKSGIRRTLAANTTSEADIPAVNHPCMHNGYNKVYRRIADLEAPNPPRIRLVGKPHWKACGELAARVVNATAPCLQPPCALGTFQPATSQPLYALTGFHVIYHFFGLEHTAHLEDLESKGQRFCDTQWDTIAAHRGAEIHVDHYCFRVPYMVNLLRHGLGVPENQTKIGTGQEAWTLGAALAEGSKVGAGRGPKRKEFSRQLAIIFAVGSFLVWAAFLGWTWRRGAMVGNGNSLVRKSSGSGMESSLPGKLYHAGGVISVPYLQHPSSGPKLPLSHSSGEVHFPPSPTAAIGGNFNSNIARLSSQTSQRKRIPSLDNLQTLR